MKKVRSLRSYRYRNDAQISEYLEQIREGAVEQTTVTTAGERSRGGRAGLRSVVEANIGSTSTTSESFNIAATPTSRARQVEDWLDGDIQPLGPMDDAAFALIKRGEFVRTEGTLRIPEVIRTVLTAAAFGKLAGIVEALGVQLEGVETVTSQADAVWQLVQMDGFPIIVEDAAGGPTVLLVARPQLILGEPLALDGEVFTVFGRVTRTIPATSRITQSEILPQLTASLPSPNRQQRRAQPNATKPLVIRGPVAVVDPIAIYC